MLTTLTLFLHHHLEKCHVSFSFVQFFLLLLHFNFWNTDIVETDISILVRKPFLMTQLKVQEIPYVVKMKNSPTLCGLLSRKVDYFGWTWCWYLVVFKLNGILSQIQCIFFLLGITIPYVHWNPTESGIFYLTFY